MKRILSVSALLLALLCSGCRPAPRPDQATTVSEAEIIGTVSVPQISGVDDNGWLVAKSQTYGHSVRLPGRFAEYTTELSSGDELHGFTCKLNTGYELTVVRCKDQERRSEEDFFAQVGDSDRRGEQSDVRGPFDFNGHRAMHITSRSSAQFGQMRFVYVDGVVYLLTVEGPRGRDSHLEKTISLFFDSLEITEGDNSGSLALCQRVSALIRVVKGIDRPFLSDDGWLKDRRHEIDTVVMSSSKQSPGAESANDWARRLANNIVVDMVKHDDRRRTFHQSKQCELHRFLSDKDKQAVSADDTRLYDWVVDFLLARARPMRVAEDGPATEKLTVWWDENHMVTCVVNLWDVCADPHFRLATSESPLTHCR